MWCKKYDVRQKRFFRRVRDREGHSCWWAGSQSASTAVRRPWCTTNYFLIAWFHECYSFHATTALIQKICLYFCNRVFKNSVVGTTNKNVFNGGKKNSAQIWLVSSRLLLAEYLLNLFLHTLHLIQTFFTILIHSLQHNNNVWK